MTPLEQSIDSTPASNLAIERRFLGALLLSNKFERNEATRWVNRHDFHDPFHEWMFIALRSARTCETLGELLSHLSEQARESPPNLTSPITQGMVAELIYTKDGLSCGANVQHLRRYAAELSRLGQLRQRQVKLEAELLAVLQEAVDGIPEADVRVHDNPKSVNGVPGHPAG